MHYLHVSGSIAVANDPGRHAGTMALTLTLKHKPDADPIQNNPNSNHKTLIPNLGPEP